MSESRIYTKGCECIVCEVAVRERRRPLTTLEVSAIVPVPGLPNDSILRVVIQPRDDSSGLLRSVTLKSDSVKKLLYSIVRRLDSRSNTKTSRGAASAICQLIRTSL